MSAIQILIDRCLQNANVSNLFYLRDNARVAAAELAEKDAALEAAREFIGEHLSEENCPTCLSFVTHHEPDCKAAALLAALLAALEQAGEGMNTTQTARRA